MGHSSDKVTNNTKNLSIVIDKYGKDIPTEISLALKEILEKKLKDIDFNHDMDSKKSMDIVVHDYMKKIAPTLKQVSKQIADILHSKMKAEYESLKEKNK